MKLEKLKFQIFELELEIGELEHDLLVSYQSEQPVSTGYQASNRFEQKLCLPSPHYLTLNR